jgi:hypothetical protein
MLRSNDQLLLHDGKRYISLVNSSVLADQLYLSYPVIE